MNSFLRIAALAVFVGICHGQVVSWGKCPDVNVQSNFEIKQYMGKWYEMERFFAIFQFLTDCVTADYKLQDNNMVSVNNTGYSKLYERRPVHLAPGLYTNQYYLTLPQGAGNFSTYGGKSTFRQMFKERTRDYTTAIGEAKVMDPKEKAKLGVKFFSRQSYGDYWVLSTDYNSYSVVWSCTERPFWPFGQWNTQFAWILTRKPEGIPETERSKIIDMLDNYGIKTNKFSKTRQTSCPGR